MLTNLYARPRFFEIWRSGVKRLNARWKIVQYLINLSLNDSFWYVLLFAPIIHRGRSCQEQNISLDIYLDIVSSINMLFCLRFDDWRIWMMGIEIVSHFIVWKIHKHICQKMLIMHQIWLTDWYVWHCYQK